ncbi:MAG: isorenieratene synthase [Micrococcales bacterium 73-15]|mgnify:CR=1 FL=1|uniref:FAD-dependent oxidoreductase n=1 Tax=Salana multivorans TaxID=120377 RepID=UPI00096A0381|nr:FAD-dependent oxidoreductase [Salana multivorans]OJX94723.1 MAG: isorenieratene synthase [Micrococcales bacterium 73-15]
MTGPARGGRADLRDLPGRDPRAVRHPARPGRYRVTGARRVVVVGGGIAGIAAATVLAERGVEVTLVEADPRLGGRVAAWPLDDGRTMSRGFHAFFRQYYNLRSLLRRVDPDLARLVAVEDYPLQRPDGLRDSFAGIPRTPPFSILGFVAASPTFTARSLLRVNVPAALELLRVSFPETYSTYDGESAADFLERLRFPAAARDLALEVFARSFFADPSEFAAGELVAMFHTYFLGSGEGLLFDVPDDDYDTALWAPLAGYLDDLGVRVLTSTRAAAVEVTEPGARVVTDAGALDADAVVLATDPRSARGLVAATDLAPTWREEVADTRNSPPFVVVRLWLDGEVDGDRPPFVGTSGYGPLDNVSVLERFEAGAAAWSARAGGSVVELHAYACRPSVVDDEDELARLVGDLETELHRLYPETAGLAVRAREVLVRDDCALIGPTGWDRRPGVRTPSSRLVLAGDWVRCDYPVALMERAATTGYLAANALLEGWGVQGQDVWTVPMTGLLRRPGGSAPEGRRSRRR